MGTIEHIVRAKEFEKKAKKKLVGWRFFNSKESKHKQAAKLFHEAAHHYKLARAWDKAGYTLGKLALCHLKTDSKEQAAEAFLDAAECHSKTCLAYLDKGANLLCVTGSLDKAGVCYEEIAKLRSCSMEVFDNI
ncbi:alpha-soluble NSF attachment protein 2-like [Rosa rugosa]|uniref:alpha-soluble NSF attachment protein 2-like n=1 Tax=Rosa rugosa TaxID=74645 RepID=UPI002B41455C|nr:alpha-soluble NSF attachment protein 2-like [Rosa rugosa]